MNIPNRSRKATVAFATLVDKLGRDDVIDILLNWDDCELSEDGTGIIQYVGRDRDYSHGKNGGKAKVSKADFLNWLLSDAPFDEAVYGPRIREDTDWGRKIDAARSASGLHLNQQ